MTRPYLLDVPDVVALERAIAGAGTPLAVLMERAGHAVAAAVTRLMTANDAEGPVLVLAGSGNNGGDGWVTAGALAAKGRSVTLVTPKAADALTAEPARHWATEETAIAPSTLNIVVDPDLKMLSQELARASVVVDALLGTGFAGTTVRAPIGAWISQLNAERDRRVADGRPPLLVVAADVPSGVSAQTGAVADPSVRADETVTMIVAKPGLYADRAAVQVGAVVVDELDVTVADYLPSTAFRHGIPDDLDKVVELYRLMIAATTGTDNDPMWLAGNHPSREGLADAIAAGELLVGEDRDSRALVAAAVLDQDWNPGYDQGKWTISTDPATVWTLHLVAVHPDWQHRGLGRALMEYAARCARSAGGTVFRIDVLASNRLSLEFYERLGFRRVGPVTLHYDDPRVTEFVLFEKQL